MAIMLHGGKQHRKDDMETTGIIYLAKD